MPDNDSTVYMLLNLSAMILCCMYKFAKHYTGISGPLHSSGQDRSPALRNISYTLPVTCSRSTWYNDTRKTQVIMDRTGKKCAMYSTLRLCHATLPQRGFLSTTSVQPGMHADFFTGAVSPQTERIRTKILTSYGNTRPGMLSEIRG